MTGSYPNPRLNSLCLEDCMQQALGCPLFMG